MSTTWVDRIGPLALLIAMAAVGGYRLQFGYDLSDESYYAVAGQRHALGDVPFRDAADGALSMFDLLLWPIFELRPQVTLLQLRGLGLGLLLTTYVALYCLLQRHLRPWHAAVACAAGFFALSNWFWVPGYNATFLSLTVLGVSLWLIACDTDRPARQATVGLAAGIVWAVGCFCYLPMGICTLPLGAVLALGVFARRMRQPLFRSAAWVVAGMTATTLLLLAAFWRFDLLGPWLDAVARMSSVQLEYIPVAGRARGLLRAIVVELAGPLVAVAACFGLAMVLARRTRGVASWLKYAALVAGCVGAVGFVIVRTQSERADFTVCVWLTALAASLHLNAAFGHLNAAFGWSKGGAARRDGAAWRHVYLVLLAVAALGFFGQGFFSDCRLYSAMSWTGPLVTLGLAHAFRAAEQRVAAGPSRPTSVAPVMAASVAACVLAVYAQFAHLYREAPIGELTAAFSIGPLCGVRSTPERVAAIEAVAEFLAARVQPGDMLLTGHSSCVGLHYLTTTRPALKAAWLSERLDCSYSALLVGDMIQSGRVPRYYVRTARHTAHLGNSRCPPVPDTAHAFGRGMNEVHTYVRENYIPIHTIYPFQIWQKRDDATAGYIQRILGHVAEDFSADGGPVLPDVAQAAGRAGRLHIGVMHGRFAAAPTVVEGRRMWTVGVGELPDPSAPPSRWGRLRRALGGASAPQEGRLVLYLELDGGVPFGEEQVVLTADVAVDAKNTAFFFVETETDDGVQTTRYPIPPGTHRNIGIDTVSPPKTRKLRGGIEFVPTREGQELSIGAVRLDVEEFSQSSPPPPDAGR